MCRVRCAAGAARVEARYADPHPPRLRLLWAAPVRRQHEPNINTGELFSDLYAGPRRAEMQALVPLQVLLPLLTTPYGVLDVGCGWGQYVPYLNVDYHAYRGIDFAEGAIADARANQPPHCQFDHADFSGGLPYEDDSFGTVLCLETLEHMPDPQLLVDEMHRVCIGGGHVVVGVPYRDSIVTPEHLWEYSEEDWPVLFSAFTQHAVFRFSVGAPDMWEHFLVVARK